MKVLLPFWKIVHRVSSSFLLLPCISDSSIKDLPYSISYALDSTFLHLTIIY